MEPSRDGAQSLPPFTAIAAASSDEVSPSNSLSLPPTDTTTTTTDPRVSDDADDATTTTSEPILTGIDDATPLNSSIPAAAAGGAGLQVKKRGRKRKHFPSISMVLRPHAARSFALTEAVAAIAQSEQGLTTRRRRRRIPAVLSKEVDVETLIAISAGFPTESLTEEEIEANVVSTVGGSEQSSYLVVRNHILATWRSDVSVFTTREQALECIRSEHRHLVDKAYQFLLEHGYINFGLAPAIKQAKLESSAITHGKDRPNVIVVGAGLAGLAAARQLISLGFKVILLEGRNRPGGRVKTKKMCDGGGEVVAAADLGGSVLTGINGNPFGVLARQLGFPLHKVRDICPLYLPDGKPVDSEVDERVEAAFNKLLEKVCKLRQVMIEEVKSVDVSLGSALETFRNVFKVAEDRQERMLLNWHLANLEYANATLLSNLSMAFWDQDDPYEMGGDHCFIPGGNERFVRALAEDLPIFYERTVESIAYGDDGVLVSANGQHFWGDMALCTVPLGVLKRGAIKFQPELPQKKKDAIERLGFGLLNKVAMLFTHDFWGGEIDTFGHLTEDQSMRGEFFLFYSYTSVAGGPLLVALVAGEAAGRFEKMSPLDSVERVMEILRGIFTPKGIEVPNPIQAVCTRWGQDQFAYGSYSYVSVGSSGEDYDILAESIGDGRVFFAGEATSKLYPATMHGAFLSGMREAANMLRAAKKKSLIVDDNKAKVEEDGAKVDNLDKLFEKPDLEFGSFSVLFNPESEGDLELNSLLRVGFDGGKSGSGLSVYMYGLIQKDWAIALSKMDPCTSGDKVKLLDEKYGVKLVGRRGLCPVARKFIESIKSARARLN